MYKIKIIKNVTTRDKKNKVSSSPSPNHNPMNNLKYIISKYDLNHNKKSIMYEYYQND